MANKILILYSGGLDSKIMEFYAKKKYPDAEIKKVWYDIGQEYNYKERACLEDDVDIKSVDWLGEQQGIAKDGSSSGAIFIPGRNAVLALLGASQYLPNEIWLGALRGEKSTDKDEEFKALMNDLMKYVFSPFDIVPILRFPFFDEGWGKKDAVDWAFNNGLDINIMLNSSSCLSGEKGNCGTCVVCVRRWGIFYQLGFKDLLNKTPFESVDSVKYLIAVLTDDHYDSFRKAEIVPALKTYFNIEDESVLLKLLNSILTKLV